MIYAKIKSKDEQQLLDKAIRDAKNKGWYRRLMIIKLSSQGKFIRHLKKEFGICEATIRSYIHDYNASGLDGLRPKRPTGRPSKIAHWKRQNWDSVFERPPSHYYKLKTDSDKWTLKLMAKYLIEYHHIKVCISSIHNSLRKNRKQKHESSKSIYELNSQI